MIHSFSPSGAGDMEQFIKLLSSNHLIPNVASRLSINGLSKTLKCSKTKSISLGSLITPTLSGFMKHMRMKTTYILLKSIISLILVSAKVENFSIGSMNLGALMKIKQEKSSYKWSKQLNICTYKRFVIEISRQKIFFLAEQKMII